MSEGLAYVATNNAATLFSSDLTEAISAAQQKRIAKFND